MWQIKTRLQASVGVSNPPFSNTFQAFPKIISEGGLRGLYRGAGPLIVRGALMNSGNTLGYDFAKTYNRKHQVLSEGFALHVSASVFAAFSTTLSFSAICHDKISNIHAIQLGSLLSRRHL